MKTLGIEIDKYTGHLFHDIEAYIVCLSKIKQNNVEVVFVRSIPHKYFIDDKNYQESREHLKGLREPKKPINIWLFEKLFNKIKYVDSPDSCDEILSRKKLSPSCCGISKYFADYIFDFPVKLWQQRLNLNNLIVTGDKPLKILYSCRQNTGRRLDEDSHNKLCSIVKKYNGTIIETFEGVSLKDQIDIFNNHNCLIGVHGNNLTGLMWMPSNSSVFEILPSDHRRKVYDYWAISNVMKHNYQLINAFVENPYYSWKLDSKTLSLIDSNFHYLNVIMEKNLPSPIFD